jgi:hypothetical protein
MMVAGATAMGRAVELVYPDFIYFKAKHPKPKEPLCVQYRCSSIMYKCRL